MGTEEFWVPAAIAALGSGVQYANQKGAQDRSDAATIQGLQHQQEIQQEGVGKVAQLTKDIAANSPQQIQAKATGDYVKQLRQNAASPKGSALAPAVGANPRYTADVNASQTATAGYGNDLASQMAGIDAAVRQRQNEGLAMNTTGMDLNLLGAKSYGTNFVDTLRAQLAGQENPWLSLASSALGGAAGTMSKNWTPSVKKTGGVVIPNSAPMADNGLNSAFAGAA